ncbi:MAG: tetratricopeptide repeat protein [Alphaproteobacteria bacterium]|nr:tetratricopeptide repeat protein [Alphaproteobacteria bacterium]
MKKKTIILWFMLCAFLSACVYLTLPSSCDKKETESSSKQVSETQISQQDAKNEMDLNDIIEEYFANRPVRDVPQDANFSAFLVGSYAKSHRDFKTTANSFEKVLKSDLENKEIKENLYLYFILAGQFEQSVPYAYQALDGKESDVLPLLVVLTDEVQQGMYDEALKSIEKIGGNYKLLLQPLLKSWVYVGLKNKKKALNSLEPLKNEKNLQAAYYLHRALIFDYFGDTKNAAEAYASLMKTEESKNVRVLLLLKDFETRTHALTDKKTFALRYAQFQEQSFISKEMLTSSAEGERVLNPTQGTSWVFFDMGSAMGQVKNLDLSLFFANLALYLNPKSSITQLFMGEILEELDMLEQANELYATVTPNQNIFLSVKVRSIMNQIKMKQFDAAIEALTQMLKVNPKVALFHMTLGDAYREKGDYENALRSYQNAGQLVLGRSDKQVAPVYFYQGVCLESLGNKEEALDLFKKALSLDGENPIYLNYTGYTLLEQNKDIPRAFEMIQKAVAKMPNDGSILDSLGWAYYLMGDYDKALPILEQAVTLLAGNAVLNSHLGDIYWQLGRYREARFQWAHASSLTENLTPELKDELTQKIENGLTSK